MLRVYPSFLLVINRIVWALPESRRSYSQALLRTVEYLTGEKVLPAAAGTTFGSCFLERRIDVILNRVVNRKMSRAACVVTLVAGVSALPVAVTQALSADPPGAPGSRSQVPPADGRSPLGIDARSPGKGEPREDKLTKVKLEFDNDLGITITGEKDDVKRVTELLQRLGKGRTNNGAVAPNASDNTDLNAKSAVTLELIGNTLTIDGDRDDVRRVSELIHELDRSPSIDGPVAPNTSSKTDLNANDSVKLQLFRDALKPDVQAKNATDLIAIVELVNAINESKEEHQQQAKKQREAVARLHDLGVGVWQYEPNRLGKLNRRLPVPIRDGFRAALGGDMFSSVSRVSILKPLDEKGLKEMLQCLKSFPQLNQVSVFALRREQLEKVKAALPDVTVEHGMAQFPVESEKTTGTLTAEDQELKVAAAQLAVLTSEEELEHTKRKFRKGYVSSLAVEKANGPSSRTAPYPFEWRLACLHPHLRARVQALGSATHKQPSFLGARDRADRRAQR